MVEGKKIFLTLCSRFGGCGAKMGPADLKAVLSKLPVSSNKSLLVNFDKSDDAGIYKINEDLALVNTVDFFTPIVDSPYHFGMIAAANSLSDVYAMGGKPLMALNIVCFPSEDLDKSILENILQGGYDKLKEAGVTLVGGHTLSGNEIIYGFAVTGTIHPRSIITNANAHIGDKLILTKPLGTGIITTANRRSHLDQTSIQISSEILNEAIEVMSTLNEQASIAMIEVGVHSCTDITGFGLLGHLYEMVAASEVGAVIQAKEVPVLSGVSTYAKMRISSSAARRNEDYLKERIIFKENIAMDQKLILFDAQTSGGLLISVAPEKTDTFLSKLNKVFPYKAKVIGEVISPMDNNIVIIVE